MGHFVSFYTDFDGPFSKLMGLWRMARCLPNHWKGGVEALKIAKIDLFFGKTGLSHPFLGLGPGALGIGKNCDSLLGIGRNNKTYFVIHILVSFKMFKYTCIFIHTVLLEINVRFHTLFFSNLSFFLHYFSIFLKKSNWGNLGSKLGKKDTVTCLGSLYICFQTRPSMVRFDRRLWCIKKWLVQMIGGLV